MFKNFLLDEEGMGTVELVLIIAVLVAIAVGLRGFIIGWFNDNVKKVFSNADAGVTGLETYPSKAQQAAEQAASGN